MILRGRTVLALVSAALGVAGVWVMLSRRRRERALDAALWNMTLNTNGLSFEAYEKTIWLASKQSALNPAGVWDPQPAVKNEIATQNANAASAREALIRARWLCRKAERRFGRDEADLRRAAKWLLSEGEQVAIVAHGA